MKKIQLILMAFFFGFQFMPAMAQLASLNEEEQKDVLYMLEEEKLARDVYIALGEKWDVNVFKNIIPSEERHISMIKQIAKNNNLDIPGYVLNDTKGKFENPDLQKLYTELVNTGNQSLVEALKIGAKIEEIDIKDLDTALSRTQNTDLTNLYNRLQEASENHFRSFVKSLSKQGVAYQAIVLDNLQFVKIMADEGGKGSCCSGKADNASSKGKKANKKSKTCCSDKSNSTGKNKKNGKGCCSKS